MPEGQRMTEHEVELSHWYDATPERVFHAWIDADALAQWMGPFNTKTEVHEQDLRVGGTFRWTIYEDGRYPVHGTFLEIDPPHRLRFTWIWDHGDYEGVETEVTLTMEPQDGGTRLTLRHVNLLDAVAAEKHGHGWGNSLDVKLPAFLAAT